MNKATAALVAYLRREEYERAVFLGEMRREGEVATVRAWRETREEACEELERAGFLDVWAGLLRAAFEEIDWQKVYEEVSK